MTGMGSEIQPAPPGSAWAVLHTRPRSEKKAAEFCRSQQVPVFLPLRRKVHRYGGRTREFHSPLFAGYVFCVLAQQQIAVMRQNRHVAHVLETVRQDELVGQLRQIEVALSLGDALEILPYLEVGRKVRVSWGPFKNLEGVILRHKGRDRLVMNVDLIRESVAMDIDTACLEPV